MKSEIHSKNYLFGDIRNLFFCYLETMIRFCSCVSLVSLKCLRESIVELSTNFLLTLIKTFSRLRTFPNRRNEI